MTIQYPEFWKSRLAVPTYRVKDAARYAGTSPQTVGSWQRLKARGGVVAPRDPGDRLNYLQLIEVGVVAAMRKAGVPLKSIRNARNFLASKMGSQNPFAEYRFKTDGKQLLLGADEVDSGTKDKLIVVSEAGQYAWKEILQQLLREFEYSPEDGACVMRWQVAGVNEPVIIDPRVAFGSPQVGGVPTGVLRDRWNSGESVRDIADDFDIDGKLVMSALRFENVEIDLDRPAQWAN
ncbi:MAG: hypothetical protein WDZ83_06590 [Rhizobiaceae bacterium]